MIPAHPRPDRLSTFKGGEADEERAWKVLPGLSLTNRLADGLPPI